MIQMQPILDLADQNEFTKLEIHGCGGQNCEFIIKLLTCTSLTSLVLTPSSNLNLNTKDIRSNSTFVPNKTLKKNSHKQSR